MITSITSISNSTQLISTGFDRTIKYNSCPFRYTPLGPINPLLRYWDISSGECTFTTEDAHSLEVTDLHLINGTFHVSVGADATMRLWTLHPLDSYLQPRLLHTFTECMEPFHGVRYNGRDRLFTFGSSKVWRMWSFTQNMLCRTCPTNCSPLPLWNVHSYHSLYRRFRTSRKSRTNFT